MKSSEIAFRAITTRMAQQESSELTMLLDIVRHHRPTSLLEVGVFRGGTLYCWEQIGIELVYGIDINYVHLLERYGAEFHQGNAQDVEFRDSLGFQPGSIDVLFIDGDHSYGGVKANYEDWKYIVCGGGLIIFHDINDLSTGVPKFWEEVKNNALSVEISASNQWGGFGILVMNE